MSIFEDFDIDNIEQTIDVAIDPVDRPIKVLGSLFTVVYDSREQLPYTFDNIYGDDRDTRAKINVKVVRRGLQWADYGIDGFKHRCVVERKSKADLFGSVANKQKRENFLERIRKMQERSEYAAVVMECNFDDIFVNPLEFTSLSPKSVYRTILSWQQQFNNVHWVPCIDRDFAEQTTYRLLEKFYTHDVETKYVHKNKPIDENIEAFRLGLLTRRSIERAEMPYCYDNPLRVSWLRGWGFSSLHDFSGNRGQLFEEGELPDENEGLPLFEKPAKKRKMPKKAVKIDPNKELEDLFG